MRSEAHVDFLSTSCGQLLCSLRLQQQKSDAWDCVAMTSACKLCSMVISFWFQLVFKARLFGSYAYLLRVDLWCSDVLLC